MNPKLLSINKNLFGARSRRSCLQLPVALAILCWSSLAQAQFQTETWLGAASGTSTWTNILAWKLQGVSSNGDALIFGSQSQITLPGFTNSVNNFPTTVINTTLHTTNQFGIYSITFNSNGFNLSGNALQITNGITDNSLGVNTNGGPNSEAIPLTLGANQTFQNNSTLIGTNSAYFTNTESGTINLSTNVLTIAGGAPFFLTGAITSTNGGQLIVANNGGYPNGIARLSVSNSFGINVIQITNLFTGSGTFTPAITNYYTNTYVVAGVSTNFFVFSNVVASVTNGTTAFFTNTFGPQNRDAVWVQSGGTLQVANLGAIPSATSGVGGIGNLSVDGTLDLNGTSININGLDDSQTFGGVIDNLNPANTGTYTLTVGNGNSNAVFTGVIGNSSGGATVGTIALTKTGYGTETLENANYYAGPTLINQGKLVVTTGGSLGALSALMTIQPGAVLDVSGLGAQGYIPQNPLTVAAGTPTKPYTNFLGSYDPTFGTNPTNYFVTTTTNNVLTFATNVDLTQSPPTTNVITTTNFASFSFSTNSIISIVSADVFGNFTVNGGGAISPLTPIAPGIATWAIQGNLTMDNSLGLSAPLNKNRVNYLLNTTTATGGGTNDLIAVSGKLTVGDELDFIVSPLNGTLATGDYTLITSSSYVPETGGHTPVFKVVLERGLQGDTVSAVGNNIVLHSVGGAAAPGSLIWAGTPANNNWDVALSANWQTNGPTFPNPDFFFPDDNVTFSDNGVGAVNLSVVVTPGSLTFNNNKTNITFAQSQSVFITGPGGLTMNGSGSVTLQNPNSFTGDVTLNSGTLNLGYHSTASPQYVLYNGVPAGNLKMGGGQINQITQQNTAPFAAFQNLILMPGASTIAQTARTASQSPRYFFTNQLVRAVGGTLYLNPTTGNNCGIYFLNTNSPGGAVYYGTNGILGGFATIFLNDWVNAASSGAAGVVAVAYSGYQTQNNPALWGAASNVVATASLSGIGTQVINSLKITTTGPTTLNMNPGSALTLWSGGLLIPAATTPFPVTIAGGTLLGATNADLILLNNNITPGSSLLISSVIADNTNAAATQGSGLTSAGSGTTILAGNNTYSGPTYINNGFAGAVPGTLQIGAGGASGSIASSSAVFDNGTLAFNRSDNSSVSGAISGTGNFLKLGTGALTLTANNSLGGSVTISAGTLQLGNGGASGSVSNTTQIVDNGTLVFDNNNTVGYPNAISGFGSLVQFGTGNLIIATNETYVGGTVVSNGTMTLTASGSISNTVSIAVNKGATLDVSAQSGGLVLRSASPAETLTAGGTINGSLTTGSGTTVQPSSAGGTYNTMTVSGNFTMNGGGFVFNVGNGNGNHDLINAGGTLTENGGTIILNITGGTLNAGVYPLVHASAIPGGSVTNLAIYGFNQPGQIAQLIHDTVNNNLDLLVSGGSSTALTWAGDGSANIWDLNSTPNWNNGSPGATYANNSYTTFDDTGSASPAVNIKNIVSPNSISNNAVAKNYTLGASTGSSGRITGGASITQSGASQLTLQTLNDYLGATVINAGTVQLGNNTAAAEDGMVGNNNSVVINTNGTLVVSNFVTEAMSGSLTGSGQLVQQGNGKLILTGNNSAFAGSISVVTNGSSPNVFLQMGNGFTGTLGTGVVTNNRTVLLDVGPTPTSLVTVNASITGSGNVTNIGPGIALLNGTNTYAGNTVIPSGTLRLGNNGGLPSATGLYMDCNNSPGLVGTLDLNGHDVTIASLQGNNTGNQNATLVEPLIINNGSTTNTLTISGGTATTFNGELNDNNNGGTGKLALLLINNTALTLNACYNALFVNTYPSLFSGGITISNASLTAGGNSGNTSSPGNGGLAAAGFGTITLEGGLGAATNSLIRMPTNAILYSAGASGSSSPSFNTTLFAPVNVPAGQFGTIFLPQRGTFSCTLIGGGTIIVCPNYVRGEQGGDWTGFTGTIIFESMAYTGSAGSQWSINQPLGYPNATLYMQILNTNAINISGANGGNVFRIGALAGGDSSSAIAGGTGGNGSSGGAANTIWAVGGLGLSTTNGSQITDGGCGLRVVGGSLMLTNNTLNFGGQLVVSNATLALAVTPGAITNFDYPNTANYLVGTNITIVGTGVLDVTGASTNSELYIGHNGAQTLFGNGTIKGNLWVTNSLVSPGRRASDTGTYPGNLTVVSNAAINFGSTLQMAVGPSGNDSLTVNGTLAVNSARLTMTTNGVVFAPGSSNVFYLFNNPAGVHVAVAANGIGGTGTVGITNITVPALPAGMFWVTNLTLDGSMAVVNTNANTLNASAPPLQVSVSGNTLTLGWPTNLGWILQSQTNGSGVGLTAATNWFDVAGSAAQTNAVITITPTNPAVFYRLRNPTAPVQ